MGTSVIRQKVIKAKEIIDKLTKTASQDGSVTEDEKLLILNIGGNLEKYFSYIKNMSDSEPINKTEELHVLEKKIIQDATAKAFEDGKFTDDEKSLLETLSKIMEDIVKIE